MKTRLLLVILSVNVFLSINSVNSQCTISGNTITAPTPSSDCTPFNPGIIVGSTPSLGTCTLVNYQWQDSPDGSTWSDISGATTIDFDPPSLTSTTHYRRAVVATDGTSNYTNSSAGITITVYPHPIANITGPTSICGIPSTGNHYITEMGMSNYTWTVSAGGSITSGSTTNDITVTWSTTGVKIVTVTYTDGNGCSPVTPASKTVNVYALPVPIITGPSSICGIPSTGNHYITETGMSNYTWTVSAGGTITNGSTSNDITVTWSTTGTKTITVTYTDGNGCNPTVPTSKTVYVNALPIPIITGPNSICGIPSTGNHYITETGMSNYLWTVSAGGTITNGSSSNNITVTWSTTGTKTVTVTYTDGNGCNPLTPSIKTVNVYALPVPIIQGNSQACVNTSQTYTTEAGMSNYVWVVSSGGTGSSTTNTITVNWTATGPQYVTVLYTNGNGCTAASATIYPVNVVTVINPTIVGDLAACAGTGNHLYITESGMTNYQWIVSAGGNITAGGGTANNTVTVTWVSIGSQTVQVSYNASTCNSTQSTKNVTVYPIPTVTLNGDGSACVNTPGHIYTTEVGMSDYSWSIIGGTITSGGTSTSSTATVTWTSVGTQHISVNYKNSSNCTAASPTYKYVTVNPQPVPTISGPADACENSGDHIYTTEAGNYNYIWSVVGGEITSGGDSYTVTVKWTVPGSQYISITYSNSYGCVAVVPTVKTVNVNILPVPTLTGQLAVCIGDTVMYQTETGMTNYQWIVKGGIITGGGTSTTNSVTVSWNKYDTDTSVSVNYTDSHSCTAATPSINSVYVSNIIDVNVTVVPKDIYICVGDSAIFDAVPYGEGPLPTYQWKVNDIVKQNGSSRHFAYIINSVSNDNDVITCTLTSNLGGCAHGSPATSDPVTIHVVDHFYPDLTITASENPICEGKMVIMTAHPNPVYQGQSAKYTWFVNGDSTVVYYDTIFQFLPTTFGNKNVYCKLNSGLSCKVNKDTTSNVIDIEVISKEILSLTITQTPHGDICQGTNITFTSTVEHGGDNPTFEWRINNEQVGGSNNQLIVSDLKPSDTMISCKVFANGANCLINTAQINITPLRVYPFAVSGIIEPKNTVICLKVQDTIILSGQVGSIKGWQKRDSMDRSWVTIIGFTGDALILDNPRSGTFYYRVAVQSGYKCDTVLSDSITIKVKEAADKEKNLVEKSPQNDELRGDLLLICTDCNNTTDTATRTYDWGYIDGMKDILIQQFRNKAFCYYKMRNPSYTYFLDVGSLNQDLCTIRTLFTLKKDTTFMISQSSLFVYPNPNSGNFELVISSEFTGKTKISVRDILGRECQKMELDKTTDIQKVKINLNVITKGVYIIETILGNEERLTKKILVY